MIDVYGVFNACSRVAVASGKNLSMLEENVIPYTDGDTIYVPKLSVSSTPEEVDIWRGMVYHEIGHCSPEVQDIFELSREKKLGNGTLLQRTVNFLEDIRNEKNRLGEYPGRDKALAILQNWGCKESAQAIKDVKSKRELEKEEQILTDVAGVCYKARIPWQPAIHYNAEEFISETNADDLYTPEIRTLISTMTTAEDVYNLALKLIDDAGGDSEQEQQKAQEAYEEQEANGGSSEEGDEDSELTKAIIKPISHHEVEDGEPMPISDYFPAEGPYNPHTKSRVIDAKSDIKRWKDNGYLEEMTRLYEEGSGLSNSTKRLFQSKSQASKSIYQKSGRLNKTHLYRVPAGDDDVFWKKSSVISPKGTALFVLTDASGSMCGPKYATTGAAAALMNDALQPLGMPIMIGSFTEQPDGPLHIIIKNWNDRPNAETIMKRYNHYGNVLEQNADGDSILWAYRELMKRDEKRKILIVLSDGEPSCWNDGDISWFTEEVVKGVSKRVECYGIGIETKAVKRYYPEYSVLKDTSELNSCLLDVIKRKIIG